MTCNNSLLFLQEKYHSKNDLYLMYEFIMFIELATLTGHAARKSPKTFSKVPEGFYSSISIGSGLPGENSSLVQSCQIQQMTRNKVNWSYWVHSTYCNIYLSDFICRIRHDINRAHIKKYCEIISLHGYHKFSHKKERNNPINWSKERLKWYNNGFPSPNF